MTTPRTWELPPSPGPEVTAVRDANGALWSRTVGGWLHQDDDPDSGLPWSEVLTEFGPLFDATEETTP